MLKSALAGLGLCRSPSGFMTSWAEGFCQKNKKMLGVCARQSHGGKVSIVGENLGLKLFVTEQIHFHGSKL